MTSQDPICGPTHVNKMGSYFNWAGQKPVSDGSSSWTYSPSSSLVGKKKGGKCYLKKHVCAEA